MRFVVVAALATLVLTPSASAQQDQSVHPNPARVEKIDVQTQSAILIPVRLNGKQFTTATEKPFPTTFGAMVGVCASTNDHPAIAFQNDTPVDLTIRFTPSPDQMKNADAACQRPCPSLKEIDAGVKAIAAAECDAKCAIDASKLGGCMTDVCKALDVCKSSPSCRIDRALYHNLVAKIDPGLLVLARASANRQDMTTPITGIELNRLNACDTPLCRALRAACDVNGNGLTCTIYPDQFPSILGKCDSVCSVTRSVPPSKDSRDEAQIRPYRELVVQAKEKSQVLLPSALFDSSTFTRDNPDSKKTEQLPLPYEFIVTGPDPMDKTKVIETRFLVTDRPDSCIVPKNVGTSTDAALVPLDNTGVASWRYQNPRNPACITCEDQLVRGVAFRNRTADRTFTISLTVPKDIAPQLVRAGAFQKCKADKACTVSLNVPPQHVVLFDKSLIGAIPKTQMLKFDVNFFDETEKPAHPAAYLRQAYLNKDEALHFNQPNGDIMTEPDGGQPDINVVANISGVRDMFIAPVPKTVTAAADVKCPGIAESDVPSFDPKKYDPDRHSALCADNPYSGGYRKRYTALGRLEIAKRLGSRADAFLGLVYRDEQEPFGTPQLSRVGTSQYYVNVYGLTGLTLRFGRTTWASSSNNIAFNEKGDGYQVSLHELSFSNIVKRESQTGTGDRANNDLRSNILQLRSVAFPWSTLNEGVKNHNPLRMFRSFDATAIRGTDKVDHTYSTYGGEVFYAITNIGCHGNLENCSREPKNGESKNYGTVAGSLAGYQSARHLRHDADCTMFIVCRDGRGNVALVTATWTPAVRPAASGTGFETVRSVSVRWGIGSGNRTPIANAPAGTVDHSYIGETASFAPADIFGTFQGAIDSRAESLVGPSLANKRYWGVTYTDNTTSPLEWLVDLLDLKNDVAGKSTIFQFNDFRFRYPVFGETDGGREASVQFQVESPRGIKVTVGASYFDPGAVLQPIIKTRVWTAFSKVSLTL
jgi:hypothetical protein